MNGKEIMNWETKVWGRVMHIFSSEKAGVSYLEVEEGFQCSRHFHKQRDNSFAVITGKLLILEWIPEEEDYDTNYSGLEKKTILLPGQSYSVRAFIDHRFCVLSSGIVVEFYSPDHDWHTVDISDIIRKDEGRKMSDKMLAEYGIG